jgi:predicted metal-binding protein
MVGAAGCSEWRDAHFPHVQWFGEFEKILKNYQWDVRILYLDEQTDADSEV